MSIVLIVFVVDDSKGQLQYCVECKGVYVSHVLASAVDTTCPEYT
jgi:hypothetical protein